MCFPEVATLLGVARTILHSPRSSVDVPATQVETECRASKNGVRAALSRGERRAGGHFSVNARGGWLAETDSERRLARTDGACGARRAVRALCRLSQVRVGHAYLL